MTLFWLILSLAFLLLLAACVILLVNRWRKRKIQVTPTSSDQLAEFRVLYEQGQLSREEFDRIRSLLGSRLRSELELPAQPPSTASDGITPLPKPNGDGSPHNGNGA